jgi:phage terminase large subunit-like protein
MTLKLNLKPKSVQSIAPNPFPGIPDPFGYGQRAVDFLRSLKHPKSRLHDRGFQLDPWQEEIVRRIYGPCDAHRSRIVKTVCILVPRGNRKTSLAGALALLHTQGPEAMPGGEVLFAAADRKQARIGYQEAVGIIKAGEEGMWIKGKANGVTAAESRARLQDYRNKITFANDCVLEAIASDANTQHGRTPTAAICDEIHAWQKRDLFDVTRTGLVKTPGSLLVVITTAGRGKEGFAYEFVDYARKVARGDIDDPSFLPILFETSEDEDWKDEAVWRKANPGLPYGYPDIAGLRQMAREAEHRPADREAFRILHLNTWLDGSANPFVDMALYDEGAKPVDLDALKDRPCWLAVDLSATTDLTAIVAAWQDGKDGYIVHPWFFCPKQGLVRKSKEDGVPYTTWAEQGFITPTPGNVVDYRAVEQQIRDLCDQFDVREIAFDPWNARNMIASLLEDGYPAVEMRQGAITMAPAVKELERAILAKRFVHGGHPVLRWNFANVAVEIDKADGKSFHKGKSTDRIDGAQAAAMAVGRAHAGGGEDNSLYTDPANADLFLW